MAARTPKAAKAATPRREPQGIDPWMGSGVIVTLLALLTTVWFGPRLFAVAAVAFVIGMVLSAMATWRRRRAAEQERVVSLAGSVDQGLRLPPQ